MMIFLFNESREVFSKAGAVGLFFGSHSAASRRSWRIYWQTTNYGGDGSKKPAVRFQHHQTTGAMI